LKQNKRFKRKMAANGSFIKSWNSLVKSEKLINTANLDELLDKGRGFMDVTKALALHLYERKNDYNLPCYVSYMKDLDDESLGLFCYLELMGLRDRSIYKNIMDYYCDLAASSSPRFSREPMVITIGSGHLPDIVGRLRSNLGPNINVKTYAYKSSIDYAIDAKEYVRVSAKNMNSGLFNQDFYEIMEKSIDFFNGPELTVIDEGASPLSILGRL